MATGKQDPAVKAAWARKETQLQVERDLVAARKKKAATKKAAPSSTRKTVPISAEVRRAHANVAKGIAPSSVKTPGRKWVPVSKPKGK